MRLSIKQKKIKIQSKKYYVILLLLNDKIISRIGYIIPFKNYTLVRISLNDLYKYLYLYESIIHINKKVYSKIFILFYFFLLRIK